jgi:hypothetical protein
VFAEVRAGVTLEEIQMVSHYLPFLVENHVLRLPGEASALAPEGLPVDTHVAYQKEMGMVKQSALCKKLYRVKHAAVHARLLAEGDYTNAAMVLSTEHQKKVARWVKGGLYGNLHNRLSTRDFLQAIRLRLLVPEYQGKAWVCGCNNAVLVSDDFNHLLHCKAASIEINFRHNAIRKVVADFCRICVGAQGQVQEEVVYGRRGELSACRIDIVVTTAIGETYYVDTTVVNPGATKYVYGGHMEWVNRQIGSSHVKGCAAETKSESKQRDHLQRLSPAQMAGFVPFAVETGGMMGQAAVAFLQKMEQCHNARLGDGAAGTMRKRRAWFLLEFGMALARGTAKILSAARAKIRMRRDAAQVEAGDFLFDDDGSSVDNGVGGEGNELDNDFQLGYEDGAVGQDGSVNEDQGAELVVGDGNGEFGERGGYITDEQLLFLLVNRHVGVDDEMGGPEV